MKRVLLMGDITNIYIPWPAVGYRDDIDSSVVCVDWLVFNTVYLSFTILQYLKWKN